MSILVNTSFNVKDEPIGPPEDAFRCFLYSDLDYLILGNYLLDKKNNIKIWKRLFNLNFLKYGLKQLTNNSICSVPG